MLGIQRHQDGKENDYMALYMLMREAVWLEHYLLREEIFCARMTTLIESCPLLS